MTGRGAVVGTTALALAAVAVAALAFLALQRANAIRRSWPAEADNLYLPSAKTLQLLSLGHTEAAADLVAARANVYFGTQLHARAPQRWLKRYLDTTVALDPHFHGIYLSGAAMLVYNGRPISTDALLEAVDLLERGTKVFPLDWELHFQLGFNLLFELPGVAGEEDPRVPAWRQRGVESLRQAALFEGAPYWVPNLVARMLTKRGSEDLAIRHLEQAYAVAATKEAQTQILLKLRAARGQQFSQRLEDERRAFQQLVESRYPYAPEAFSIVAGPRRGRTVDLYGAGTP